MNFDGKNHIDSLEAFTDLVKQFTNYSNVVKHCIEKYVVESKVFYLPYQHAFDVPEERKSFWDGRFHESGAKMTRYAGVWDFIPDFGILTSYNALPSFAHEFCHMVEMQDEKRILMKDFNLPVGIHHIASDKVVLACVAREIRVRALEEKFFMPEDKQDRIVSFLNLNLPAHLHHKRERFIEMGEHFKSQWSENRFEETVKSRIDFIVANVNCNNLFEITNVENKRVA